MKWFPTSGTFFCEHRLAALALILTAITLLTLKGGAQGDLSRGDDTARRIVVEKSVLPTKAIEVVKFYGLEAEGFLKEFGIELRNLGQKPIYFMEIRILMRKPGPTKKGSLTLQYGPRRLLALGSLSEFDDKAIMPGESVILRIRPDDITTYSAVLKDGLLPLDIFNDLAMWFQSLNYGDGTGYVLNSSYDKRSK